MSLADRRNHVDDSCRQVFRAAIALLKFQTIFREQWRQVLEQNLAARILRCVMIDFTDLEQREVAFPILRRPNQSGNGVARSQVEASNLARTDVDIVRSGQVGAIRGAQEPETILQDLQNAVSVDILALFGVRLQDREDDVLLAGAGQVFQAQ